MEIFHSEVNGNVGYWSTGGLFNAGSLTMTGGSISSNTSIVLSGWPGAGLFSSGHAELTDVVIADNSFSPEFSDIFGFGGGIVVADEGTLTLGGHATVRHNRADRGAGIYVRGNLYLSDNATVEGNVASDRGGGIYLSGGHLAVCDTCTVTTNRAESETDHAGGGIYVEAGTVEVSPGSVFDNDPDDIAP